jgi:NitT/TauT family transport system substrate-binding protein
MHGHRPRRGFGLAALPALGLAAALVGLALAQEPAQEPPAENPAGVPITTVEKYTYVPAETLPPVQGVSGYKWDEVTKTVVFPINVWIGWAPILAANNGTKPSDDSVFFKKYGFRVELPIIDDPIQARNAFAAGQSHILWGTLDMMALFAPELAKDSRTGLRIFQQVDWSNGGDGVVARAGIKNVNDLRPQGDKKRVIALAQNSPSHYYILNLLYFAGIKPDQVTFRFTGNAFEAANAFVNDETVDACVSWAPDIYNITDPKTGVKGAALVSSTQDAKRVIADVWAARADFAKDHPEVVEGLVRGIFDGMQLVKDDPAKAFELVDAAYNLPKGEASKMAGDAHLTNYAENAQFFTNVNNPSNFENTWDNIATIYNEAGYLPNPVAFNQVMDPRVIEKIAPDYKESKVEYTDTYSPVKLTTEEMEGKEILTRTVRIQFAPNRSDVDKNYDPNAEQIVTDIGRLAAQFGNSSIAIIGHADRSQYKEAQSLGETYLQKHAQRVKELSEQRARGVMLALITKYPQFKDQKDRFVTAGEGWTKPLETDALSRRVEIKVLTPEQ